MSEHTIDLGGLTVDVEPNGVQRQPWEHGGDAWGYRVTVRVAGESYESPAWGSRHDFESGAYPEAGATSIGAMVLGELLSAGADPDEFWEMATGGETDRRTAARILEMLEKAGRMADALEPHAEAIRELEESL